jgi:hypothetical protein
MAWTTPGTATAGEVLTAAFWNTNVRDNSLELAPFFSGFTNYTPTLTQSATISKTIVTARYLQIGKLVVVFFNLLGTSAGTAGNNVTVGLPVTARDGGSAFKYGVGHIYDDSAAVSYSGLFSAATTTSAVFVGDWSAAVGWGSNPSIAFTTNDRITGILLYEAA